MIALPLSATELVVPPSLNPGEHYRLGFVTSGPWDATSTIISDYDAFVTAQATESAEFNALNTTMQVIGWTESMNPLSLLCVISNSILNTQGELVATNKADLFDGSITEDVSYDEHGIRDVTEFVPRSFSNGTSAIRYVLGGTSTFMIGHNEIRFYFWIAAANGAA